MINVGGQLIIKKAKIFYKMALKNAVIKGYIKNFAKNASFFCLIVIIRKNNYLNDIPVNNNIFFTERYLLKKYWHKYLL